MNEDFEIEFIDEFGIDLWKRFDVIWDDIIDGDFEDNEVDGFDISCSKEKVNQLQENICVDITFGDNEIQLMYESGISNGTQLNDYSINSNSDLSDIDREYEVAIDVVVDYVKMDRLGVKYSKEKAEMLLSNHKENILNWHHAKSYDDYVTGGGTIKTNEYYRRKKQEINNLGLHWLIVTQTEVVKADFN